MTTETWIALAPTLALVAFAAGVQGFWNDVVIGLIFIAAVVFHLSLERTERAGGSS